MGKDKAAVFNIETRKVQAFVSVGHTEKALVLSVVNPFEHAAGISLTAAQAREIGAELVTQADQMTGLQGGLDFEPGERYLPNDPSGVESPGGAEVERNDRE